MTITPERTTSNKLVYDDLQKIWGNSPKRKICGSNCNASGAPKFGSISASAAAIY